MFDMPVAEHSLAGEGSQWAVFQLAGGYGGRGYATIPCSQQEHAMTLYPLTLYPLTLVYFGIKEWPRFGPFRPFRKEWPPFRPFRCKEWPRFGQHLGHFRHPLG